MGVREFPGLGFDPSPGDVQALQTAADQMDRSATTMGDSGSTVTYLHSSGWMGSAGDAFRAVLGDLPRDLGLASRAHSTAAGALRTFADGLAFRQRRGAELETQAVELRRRHGAAVAETNRLAGQRAPSGSAELADLTMRYNTARSTAQSLSGELTSVLRQASNLLDDHCCAADAASGLLRAGDDDPPYKEPPWYKRAWDATKKWIADHADLLQRISGWLKIASGICALLAMIPVVGAFFGAAALVLGGAAILIDVGLKLATGEGSWAAIGVDAALTFVPGGKLMGAGARLVKSGRAGTVALKSGKAAPFNMKLKPGTEMWGPTKKFADGTERGTWYEGYLTGSGPTAVPKAGTKRAAIPENVVPAGYPKNAAKYNASKTHLKADSLGGPPKVNNLGATYHNGVNNGPMSKAEKFVRDTARGGTDIRYRVEMVGNGKIPDEIRIAHQADGAPRVDLRIPNVKKDGGLDIPAALESPPTTGGFDLDRFRYANPGHVVVGAMAVEDLTGHKN